MRVEIDADEFCILAAMTGSVVGGRLITGADMKPIGGSRLAGDVFSFPQDAYVDVNDAGVIRKIQIYRTVDQSK